MLDSVDRELEQIEKQINEKTNLIRLLESDELPRRNSPRVEKLTRELRELIERKEALIDES